MGKLAGTPRTPGSGRKKGTKNKRSAELFELAEEIGVNPFEVMLFFAKGDWKGLGYEAKSFISGYSNSGDPIEKLYISSDQRLEAAVQASKYLYPQLKSIERSTAPDQEPKEISIKLQWDDENDSNDQSEDASEDSSSEENL